MASAFALANGKPENDTAIDSTSPQERSREKLYHLQPPTERGQPGCENFADSQGGERQLLRSPAPEKIS